MAKSADQKKQRLAAALKENLKRRKAQARAKAKLGSAPARALGTTPQAGLENASGPKPAPNRN
jgi:hypothetical protein